MCHDHIAGRLGVALHDMLLRRRHVVLTDGGRRGHAQRRAVPGRARRRPPEGARRQAPLPPQVHRLNGAAPSACPGAVGAALADAFLGAALIARVPDSRRWR
jgi:hypothetical protein